MGLFDIFKKNKETVFDTFPELSDYRIYIFLKGGSTGELKALLNEYHELYIDETPFSMDLYNTNDQSWTYITLTLLPKVGEVEPMWEYLNILLWMSQKASILFAYAFSDKAGKLPVFAEVNKADPLGETCLGIVKGKNFLCNIPERRAEWTGNVPAQYDIKKYIFERYGIDMSSVI